MRYKKIPHMSLIFLMLLTSCIQKNPKQLITNEISLIEINALPDSVTNEMTLYLAPFRETKNKLMNVIIGQSAEDMEVGQPEGLLNNLIADIMLDYANQTETTDAALSNIGGIRRSLYKGDITVGDIYEILPFDNALIILDFKGEQVNEIANVIAQKGGAVSSGLSFQIENDQATNILISGKKIEPDSIYRIVTNDYLSYGNDYFTPLTKAIAKQMLPLNMRDATISFIKSETLKEQLIQSQLKREIYVNTK